MKTKLHLKTVIIAALFFTAAILPSTSNASYYDGYYSNFSYYNSLANTYYYYFGYWTWVDYYYGYALPYYYYYYAGLYGDFYGYYDYAGNKENGWGPYFFVDYASAGDYFWNNY